MNAKTLENAQAGRLLAVSLLWFGAGPASALMVDDFTSGPVEFDDGFFATGAGNSFEGTQTGGMLGGTRHILLEMSAGLGTTFVTVPASTQDFRITNGTTEKSLVTITWDGMVAPVDFTDNGSADGIDVILKAQDLGNAMTLTLRFSDGANVSELTKTYPSGSSGTLFNPYADLTGAADLTAVTSVEMSITSPDQALDVAIDRIETRLDPNPEPGPTNPAINIEKATNGSDADVMGPDIPVGDTATFTYAVTNAGDVPLANIVVIDDNGTPGDLSDDFSPTFTGGDANGNGLLDLTEIWTYEAERTVTSGYYTNVGQVCGDDPTGAVVCDDDPSNHFGVTAPPSQSSCETAFAYSGGTNWLDDDITTSFHEYQISRWGWTNGPLDTGTYRWDIYAGAGQSDVSKGTLVGQLTVDYEGSSATVIFDMDDGYALNETHLYVGADPLPVKGNGRYTVAPGQYPFINEQLAGADIDVYTIEGLSGEVYVVAHAVVCGGFSEDNGASGVTEPAGDKGPPKGKGPSKGKGSPKGKGFGNGKK